MDQIVESRPLDTVWEALEAHLTGIKRAATDEIRSYPQPIAGCDAQIPALWEKRDGAVAELERLAAARNGSPGAAGSAIRDFIESSSFIEDDKKRDLLALAAGT